MFLLRETTLESKSFECRVPWEHISLMGLIVGFKFGQKRASPTSQGALWELEAGSLSRTPPYTFCPSVWTQAFALLFVVQISQEMLIRTNLVDCKIASGVGVVGHSWMLGLGGAGFLGKGWDPEPLGRREHPGCTGGVAPPPVRTCGGSLGLWAPQKLYTRCFHTEQGV